MPITMALTLPSPPATPAELLGPEPLLSTAVDPPLGYTGPSGVLPREEQESSHFVPVEDRWRIGWSASLTSS